MPVSAAEVGVTTGAIAGVSGAEKSKPQKMVFGLQFEPSGGVDQVAAYNGTLERHGADRRFVGVKTPEDIAHLLRRMTPPDHIPAAVGVSGGFTSRLEALSATLGRHGTRVYRVQQELDPEAIATNLKKLVDGETPSEKSPFELVRIEAPAPVEGQPKKPYSIDSILEDAQEQRQTARDSGVFLSRRAAVVLALNQERRGPEESTETMAQKLLVAKDGVQPHATTLNEAFGDIEGFTQLIKDSADKDIVLSASTFPSRSSNTKRHSSHVETALATQKPESLLAMALAGSTSIHDPEMQGHMRSIIAEAAQYPHVQDRKLEAAIKVLVLEMQYREQQTQNTVSVGETRVPQPRKELVPLPQTPPVPEASTAIDDDGMKELSNGESITGPDGKPYVRFTGHLAFGPQEVYQDYHALGVEEQVSQVPGVTIPETLD